MRTIPKHAAVAILAGLLANAAPAATPQVGINPLGASSFRLDWQGQAGTTYFIQFSTDLQSWQYLPVIDHGVDHDPFDFNATAARFFVRLITSDIPTTDPENADFDGDGLGNMYELMNDLDPLDSDSDNDGNPDGGGDGDDDGSLDATEQNGRNMKVKDHPAVGLEVSSDVN